MWLVWNLKLQIIEYSNILSHLFCYHHEASNTISGSTSRKTSVAIEGVCVLFMWVDLTVTPLFFFVTDYSTCGGLLFFELLSVDEYC